MGMTQLIRLVETMRLVELFLNGQFDENDFFRRVASVTNLVNNGASDGERQAAQSALERLIARAKTEAPKMSREQQKAFLDRLRQLTGSGEEDESTTGLDEPVETAASQPAETPVETPAKKAPSAHYGKVFRYERPGTGITAEVRTLEPKNGQPQYNFAIRIQASYVSKLMQMLTNLGCHKAASGDFYWSPQLDKFKISRTDPTLATCYPMVLSADALKRKLVAYGLKPV